MKDIAVTGSNILNKDIQFGTFTDYRFY